MLRDSSTHNDRTSRDQEWTHAARPSRRFLTGRLGVLPQAPFEEARAHFRAIAIMPPMTGMIGTIIGGVGLFLLGMILMTEGLKSLAGDALRSILERFVRGPASGLAWGAGITALVQSSSATTLMTIGFVSAGLLTFTQSVGVILGANIGTTSTGWIVSTIGLKFSMSAVALPLIGAGAIMRLVGTDTLRTAGIALAGFGLIFVGIDVLQEGMSGLAERIDPASFPGMTILGIPALIIIGAVMTVVMQSSSAAVATTLAALYTGAIGIEQAAVLVIGQNIGTTVKAALAAIGASVPAKRTALAHILFNVLTGLIALAILPVFLWLANIATQHIDGDPGAVSLAAFHTAFNIVGVLVFLPFIGPYARLVSRMVPERKPELARHLDASVAGIPSVAVEAVRRTAMDILTATITKIRKLIDLDEVRTLSKVKIHSIEVAIDEAKQFLGRVSTESASALVFARHLSSVHAIDHLESLLHCCRQPSQMTWAKDDEALREAIGVLEDALTSTRAWLIGEAEDPPVDALRRTSEQLASIRRRQRALLLEQAALRKRPPKESLDLLDAFQWLDRIGYHLWRTAHHLQRTPPEKSEAGTPELFAEGVSEVDESANA